MCMNVRIYAGIYVGEDMVIHFLPYPKAKSIISSSASSAASSSHPGESKNCPKCGHSPDRDGGVVKTCLDCFLNGNSIYVFVIGVSHKPLRFCSRLSSKPPEEVVAYASKLFKQNKFGDYSVLRNNCENFATLCKTGRSSCSQTEYWLRIGMKIFE